MRGVRLVVGLIAMGLGVPAVVFFLLRLQTVEQFITIAIPAFFGWCVAEFIGNILAKPKLRAGGPGAAMREYQQGELKAMSDPSPKA